jgi:hypothetical protein
MKKRQNISALFTIAVFYLIGIWNYLSDSFPDRNFLCRLRNVESMVLCTPYGLHRSFPIPSAFLDITDRNYAVSLLG